MDTTRTRPPKRTTTSAPTKVGVIRGVTRSRRAGPSPKRAFLRLNRGYDCEVPESMNATRSSICFEESDEPKFVGMIPFE